MPGGQGIVGGYNLEIALLDHLGEYGRGGGEQIRLDAGVGFPNRFHVGAGLLDSRAPAPED